jgi:hypothetical protein
MKKDCRTLKYLFCPQIFNWLITISTNNVKYKKNWSFEVKGQTKQKRKMLNESFFFLLFGSRNKQKRFLCIHYQLYCFALWAELSVTMLECFSVSKFLVTELIFKDFFQNKPKNNQSSMLPSLFTNHSSWKSKDWCSQSGHWRSRISGLYNF